MCSLNILSLTFLSHKRKSFVLEPGFILFQTSMEQYVTGFLLIKLLIGDVEFPTFFLFFILFFLTLASMYFQIHLYSFPQLILIDVCLVANLYTLVRYYDEEKPRWPILLQKKKNK